MREFWVEVRRSTEMRESLIGPAGRPQGFSQIGVKAGRFWANGDSSREEVGGLCGSPLLEDEHTQALERRGSVRCITEDFAIEHLGLGRAAPNLKGLRQFELVVIHVQRLLGQLATRWCSL